MFDTIDPDIRTSLIGFISGVLGAIVVFIKKILGSIADKMFVSKDKVIETLNAGKLVKDSLESLRVEWSADRASIIQFHNGGFFSNGESMQKFTVTYEEISPGVNTLSKVLKNIPLTNALWIGELINGCVIAKVEDLQDVISRTFFDEFGIKSIIGCPLKYNEKVVGLVLLQWVNSVGVFDSSNITKLSEQCKNIPYLLKPIK
jgi:hypothetical protein